MIVIDIGCATYGGDASVPYLLDEYRPSEFYGFDPGMEDEVDSFNDHGTHVVLRRAAAWTYDGTIGFKVAGLGGHVDPDERAIFPAVDLARFIIELDAARIILKMDAEGAEYVVLPHLVEHNADKLLELAIIEWHCAACGIGGNGRHREGCKADKEEWWLRRNSVEKELRCPTAQWEL